MIWGAGLTYVGHLLNNIPPVADFVTTYIDFILLGAVAVTLIPTVFHYVQSMRKARHAAKTDPSVHGEDLALDPDVFSPKHHTDAKPEA